MERIPYDEEFNMKDRITDIFNREIIKQIIISKIM